MAEYTVTQEILDRSDILDAMSTLGDKLAMLQAAAMYLADRRNGHGWEEAGNGLVRGLGEATDTLVEIKQAFTQ